MEEKALIKSAMVSRLPKFGGRSSTGGAGPLCNGSTQATSAAHDGKTAHPGTRPNCVIRASFSLKWKKVEDTTLSDPTTPTGPGETREDKTLTQLPSLAKEVKNGPPGTPKTRRSGTLTVAVSSPKAIPKQSLKVSPKVGAKLGQSPQNGPSKTRPNGFAAPARTGSESRLLRPKLGCISPRSSSQDSLSPSSDSLTTLALDSIVRSNSFTHFKQIPSPSDQHMIRSFSFNRAVELAKPLANTQLRTPRSSFLKPSQLNNGKAGVGLGGPGAGLLYSKSHLAASSAPLSSIPPAPSTPSTLKKTLLPSSVLTKPLGSIGGSVGLRLARSGQAKQQQPLLPDTVKLDVRPSAATGCGRLMAVDIEPAGGPENADSHSDSDGSCAGGGKVHKQGCDKQAAGETLEDMSLSSVSSLDRADTSEEFLDECDNVGDVFSDGELPDIGTIGGITETIQQSSTDETKDWEPLHLAEHTEENPSQDSQGPLVVSPEQNSVPQASSLDLSPSNSSGGTYMWDEEGFEPLGGAGTHLIDSYNDSELNSMDILNNHDPSGSGELEDDDLMLDVDLPEDGLDDADRMSHSDRSDRTSRQGHRRKHHRWSGPDRSFSDSRAHVFQHYDGVKAPRISSRPIASEGRQHSYAVMLDELTLDHMTQDCSSLKKQLLKLKTLLKLEDTESPADVLEEVEDNTTASQLEELIKEVQVLREELRSRDKTIAQLTLQCQQLQQQQEQTPAQGGPVQCQCHHQRAPSFQRQGDRQMDKRMQHHYDKATQTYWRPASHAGVLHHPLLSPWQAQHQGLIRTSMPQRRPTSNTTAFQPLPQRAAAPGKTCKTSPHRGPQ